MKKIVKFLVVAVFLFIFTLSVKALEPSIESKNAIVYNMDNNEVLYEKNPDEKILIASLTKIMTALVTIENEPNLKAEVDLIDEDFQGLAEKNLVTAGFRSGQVATYNDLLYGLLLPSGADAAKALARLVGGSEENFVKMMNDKAKKLQLNDTHFSNPIGYDDKENYSTVRDVAKMFKYAVNNNTFNSIITTKKYTMSDNSFSVKNTVAGNTNGGSNVLGGKTGTTTGAGRCLASYSMFNGAKLLTVTAGAIYNQKNTNNFKDTKTLNDYFKDNYTYQTLLSPGDKVLTLKTQYLKENEMSFYADKKIVKYTNIDFKKENLKFKYKGKNLITSDMKKGEKLGVVEVYFNDEKIDTIDIILNKTPQFDTIKYLQSNKIIAIAVGAFLFLIIIIIMVVRKKRKKKYGQNGYNA